MNNKNLPLISIIIPTYNHAKYLGRALRSIVDQSFSSWEAIIIDNFSKDNTEDVVKSFPNNKIKYFRLNNNGVIAKSRNFGILKARGEWIAFLDSDDWWTKNKLQICYMNIYIRCL